jgi:outer membrane immunogenic protein
MKKFLLGSVGLAAMLAGPAMAADMRVAPAAPLPVAYYDWSGAYIGGNVGGVWYDQTRTYTGAPPFVGPAFNQTSHDSDGIFGFHAGAQWQWGAWVLGVEAALSACFQECRSYTGVLPSPPFTANLTHEEKMTNLFTVGPRLGYAWDRWMVFVTGGGASATLKGQSCSTVTGLCGVTSSNGATRDQWGWYAGGGFDYMVHKGPLVDVVLGVEYQHFDVGNKNAFCGALDCNVASAGPYDLSTTGDLVRARLTIKTQGYGFLWAGPAPAY